jgi:hypothetical protein
MYSYRRRLIGRERPIPASFNVCVVDGRAMGRAHLMKYNLRFHAVTTSLLLLLLAELEMIHSIVHSFCLRYFYCTLYSTVLYWLFFSGPLRN